MGLLAHRDIRRLLSTALIFLVASGVGCTALKRCAYEGFNRDEWQHPEQVIQSLHIRPGEHVADLGSGSGYFTFRLAEAVGPTGKVYAIDIDSEMNNLVAEQARERGYENVEVILAKQDDPSLPESGVDLIFTSNTYHHLSGRVSYFSHARKYLRGKGRIAIIDFNSEGWFHQLVGHRTGDEVIQREMKEAGYSLKRVIHFLPKQGFLIFTVPSSVGP